MHTSTQKQRPNTGARANNILQVTSAQGTGKVHGRPECATQTLKKTTKRRKRAHKHTETQRHSPNTGARANNIIQVTSAQGTGKVHGRPECATQALKKTTKRRKRAHTHTETQSQSSNTGARANNILQVTSAQGTGKVHSRPECATQRLKNKKKTSHISQRSSQGHIEIKKHRPITGARANDTI